MRIKARHWIKAYLWFGAVMIAAFFVASVQMKVSKHTPKDPGLKRGLIDSVWMELPRHDVRLRSPGVWEEAWLDTTYWMRIIDPSTHNTRTVEIYKPMYWKYSTPGHKYEFIQLESDSATVAENQAEWDADSIKYQESVKRMQNARDR